MDNFCKKRKGTNESFHHEEYFTESIIGPINRKKINIQPICHVDSPGHKILNLLFAGTNKTKSGPCEE